MKILACLKSQDIASHILLSNKKHYQGLTLPTARAYAMLTTLLQSIQTKGAHINTFSPVGTTQKPFQGGQLTYQGIQQQSALGPISVTLQGCLHNPLKSILPFHFCCSSGDFKRRMTLFVNNQITQQNSITASIFTHYQSKGVIIGKTKTINKQKR